METVLGYTNREHLIDLPFLQSSTRVTTFNVWVFSTLSLYNQKRSWSNSLNNLLHEQTDASVKVQKIPAPLLGQQHCDTWNQSQSLWQGHMHLPKMCHCSQEFHRCRQWHMIMFTPTSSFLLHCSPITMTYFQFQVLSLNNLLSPVSAAHTCMDVGLSTWESDQWSHPPKQVTLLSPEPPALLRMTSSPSMLELWSCGGNCSCCERV